MYVRLLECISGTRDGVDWPPAGAVVEVPDLEGADLVRAGLAEPSDLVEEADAPPAGEAAAMTTRSTRGKRRAG